LIRTVDEPPVRIFCGGERVFADHVVKNQYRCRRCGNLVRAVSGLMRETGKRRPGVAK
jgi:hypothetical protein